MTSSRHIPVITVASPSHHHHITITSLPQAMAELDDRSVCMMSSCFARYIETHSAPAAPGSQFDVEL